MSVEDKHKLTKKRIVLPLINDVINKLVEMSADAAKLEYYDNEQASLRLKKGIVDLRDGELKTLHRFIIDLREEINNKHNQSKKTRKDDTETRVG